MNAVYNPVVDKAHERYPKGNGQFEALTLDTAFPETARVFAEKTVAQTREVYDRSKDATAGQGAVALNRKIIDIAQRNVNSGFDLANSLAAAKNLAEMMELQGAYWQAVRRARGPSRGSPRAVDQGDRRYGRAGQGACHEQHGRAAQVELSPCPM